MKRILVVDDDDHLREGHSAILSQRGRAVDTARDGFEALTLLNQNRYDVILSDLRMPGLDGPAASSTGSNGTPTTCSLAVRGGTLGRADWALDAPHLPVGMELKNLGSTSSRNRKDANRRPT